MCNRWYCNKNIKYYVFKFSNIIWITKSLNYVKKECLSLNVIENNNKIWFLCSSEGCKIDAGCK